MAYSKGQDLFVSRNALDSAKQGAWEINPRTGELKLSGAWFAMRGLPDTLDLPLHLSFWTKRLHPDDVERVTHLNAEARAERVAEVAYEYRERHEAGHWMWVMSRGRATAWDDEGMPCSFAGTDTDVTSLKTVEERLIGTQRRLQMALSSIQAGIWRYRIRDEHVDWDEGQRAIYGVASVGAPLPRDVWESALHPDDRAVAIADAQAAENAKADTVQCYRIVRPDGAVRFIRSRVCYFDDGIEGPQLFGLDVDITEEHETAEALRQAKDLAERRNVELETARADMERLAMHDGLTGLPNRRFLESIQRRQDSRCEGRQRSAMILMDLDRLKQINDVFGHDAGDHVLRRMALILRDCDVPGAFPARIGGDEFALFLAEAPDDAGLARIAQDLISRTSAPTWYGSIECRVALSVGISRSEARQLDGKKLFLEADIALYRAKKDRRQRFAFFTEAQRSAVATLKLRGDALISAVEKREFICHYQPQFEAISGRISGVEALVRWPQPDGTLLHPGDFLWIAEEIGLLSQIDRIVLDKSLADLRRWRAMGLNLQRLSVNFSAGRLADPSLPTELAALGVESQLLAFELLETTLLEESGHAIADNLAMIREKGIGIEVDDFGTGHASLLSLVRLKPDRLKIDRKLVALIAEPGDQEQVLSSIIGIGHLLGIAIVAEGVETEHQRRRLMELGCDYLQGFALAPPMEAEALEDFLR